MGRFLFPDGEHHNAMMPFPARFVLASVPFTD